MADKEMSTLDALYYAAVGAAKTPRELDNVFRRGRLHVGQRIMFKSGSAPGGWRSGIILKLGPRRAQVKFKWITSGREDEKNVPYTDILERKVEAEREKGNR